jgi:hypothetical protein
VAFSPNGVCYIGGGLGIVLKNSNAVVNITQEPGIIPKTYELYQNYPNPFNPVTKIRYQLPESGFVKLTVYDMTGREVSRLISTYQSAGTYNVEFSGAQYSSGVYFYRLETAGLISTKKMILIK